MTDSSTAGDRYSVRSSRLWAACTFKFTKLIFPSTMYADRRGISTTTVNFWLTPWIRSDEHLPMSHIAEVGHDRGFFWDSISVESSGGLNPLTIDGASKTSAREFVAHVRNIMP
jgi:hypothetical protein